MVTNEIPGEPRAVRLQVNKSAGTAKDTRRQIHLIARHGAILPAAPAPAAADNLRIMPSGLRGRANRLRRRHAKRSGGLNTRMTAAALASPVVWFAHALYTRMQLH